MKSDLKVEDRIKPLRDDIEQLGSLLDETIRRMEGELVYCQVENPRQLSKSLRPDRHTRSGHIGTRGFRYLLLAA